MRERERDERERERERERIRMQWSRGVLHFIQPPAKLLNLRFLDANNVEKLLTFPSTS